MNEVKRIITGVLATCLLTLSISFARSVDNDIKVLSTSLAGIQTKLEQFNKDISDFKPENLEQAQQKRREYVKQYDGFVIDMEKKGYELREILVITAKNASSSIDSIFENLIGFPNISKMYQAEFNNLVNKTYPVIEQYNNCKNILHGIIGKLI